MSNTPQIVFDHSSKEWLLNILGKSIDKEGYIVETSNPEQKVLTPEGQEIMEKELGVIKSGSEKYIKGDLTSLMKLTRNEI
jgi:hypothetical protein